nr:High-affnity carbon uptake protein Hat/HatR [Kibdelosporangium sp. MJ126-NF4]
MTTEHRAIVAVDIASFTDPMRTLIHLRTVHEGLYDMLREAFDEAGIAWKTVYHEDRGDGAMILVPSEFPKAWLADQWHTRLLAALRRYNTVHAPEARVQLRVVLHHGEVHMNSEGVVSHAVNLAFRLLDAKPAKSALADSGGMLALIASDDFYHEVIEQDPAADPASYQQIPVSVKQTQTVAWLRLPDVSVPARRPVVQEQAQEQPRTQMTPLSDIVDALLELPFVREATGRAMLIDMLPPNIATAVPYHAITRLHVFALVRTCLLYERGLFDLIEAVRQLDGDSGGVRRLEGIKRLLLSDSVD